MFRGSATTTLSFQTAAVTANNSLDKFSNDLPSSSYRPSPSSTHKQQAPPTLTFSTSQLSSGQATNTTIPDSATILTSQTSQTAFTIPTSDPAGPSKAGPAQSSCSLKFQQLQQKSRFLRCMIPTKRRCPYQSDDYEPSAASSSMKWDTNVVPNLIPEVGITGPRTESGEFGTNNGKGLATLPLVEECPEFQSSDGEETIGRNVEEACKRSLEHFPKPSINFPMPELDFDFRLAVKLKPEPSRLEGAKAHKEITAISSGRWSGSFGNGAVLAGGYDLGQARGYRPIRIVEGAFVMQTTDDPPAILEMRTRGSLSGPSDVLDALLSPRQPKEIDYRKYGFRMFSTIKTADKRYAEIVNCGLWVASGVWRDDEMIIDAYRVT